MFRPVRGRSTSACSSQLVWQKAPAPTMPFDGDYVGVSRESLCLANDVPVNLIIRNSVVTGGSWQGNLNPQGVVVMGSRFAHGLTAGSTCKASLERRAVAVTADVPSHSFGASSRHKDPLPAETAVDKGDDDVERAVAGEVLVPGLGCNQPSLGAVVAHRNNGLLSSPYNRQGKHVWSGENTFDDCGERRCDAGLRTGPCADDGVRRDLYRRVPDIGGSYVRGRDERVPARRGSAAIGGSAAIDNRQWHRAISVGRPRRRDRKPARRTGHANANGSPIRRPDRW
jgi:hypothetical protein